MASNVTEAARVHHACAINMYRDPGNDDGAVDARDTPRGDGRRESSRFRLRVRVRRPSAVDRARETGVGNERGRRLIVRSIVIEIGAF